MKKIISLFILGSLFLSCNKDLVKKPDNLIDKNVMEDILYDMSILDALKYQDPNSLSNHGINPKTYIFKKYKIDSLQFVKSIEYYAADYRGYKKMYDGLNARLKKEKDSVDKIKKAEDLRIKMRKEAMEKAKKEKELKMKWKKDSIDNLTKGLKAKTKINKVTK